MIRRAVIAASLLALAASAGSQNDDIPAGRSDTRQQPSTLTPGISVSGYVNVGVKKQF